MTAISQTRPLSPFSQIQEFCSSLSTLLTSLCQRTDSAFRRVYVMKKDGDGNIKFYDDRENAGKKVVILTYIENIKTGDLQFDEPNYVIATKCALIVLAMPFYTLGKIAWYAFKTPLEISALVIDTLIKAGDELSMSRFYEGCVKLRHGVSQIPDMFGNGLFEIIKAPFFGYATALASFYGIFKPYHARVVVAGLEHASQRGLSYKEDCKNIPPRPNENCWEAFAKDIGNAHPCYLAQCFQVRGNVRDARIVVIRRESIS
jgi:hypothetical protein